MNKKFFNFRRSAFGNQCFCYGLGAIGFLVEPKDLDNKFNRCSCILKITKYEGIKNKSVSIALGDYVGVNTLFEYIKRFNFSSSVDVSFYGPKFGRRARPYLMGAYIC